MYPRKLEPVSPRNVFAGEKLNGKNPNIAPPRAVTKIIEIIGESFNAKIINREIQEISEIPLERPSNPSIKLIALVIPTIHITVIVIETISSVIRVLRKDEKIILSIRIPANVTISAASVCPSNLTKGLIPFISSNIQNMARTIAPPNNPISLI